MHGPICNRLAVGNYFRFRQNRKQRWKASFNVKRDHSGRGMRYLEQEIAKLSINDARLAPTTKPEVEIWRKPHNRTVLLSMGGAGSPSNTISAWAEAYRRTKWYLDPSNRLATIP